MRFMMMVKHAEKHSGPPPKELMDAIAKLTAEDAKGGKAMIASGGLAPTAMSTSVRISRGQIAKIDGPFTEAKEVVGGFAIIDFDSKKEAIESAVRFMDLHIKHWPGWEGETEVRQIFGPEDFPPRP